MRAHLIVAALLTVSCAPATDAQTADTPAPETTSAGDVEEETTTAGPPVASAIGDGCGGPDAVTCAPPLYCDYFDDLCGQGDGAGSCKQSQPEFEEHPDEPYCPEIVDWVCACDGEVHLNACKASLAGQDVQKAPDACTPPTDTFGCGEHFCGAGQYCLKVHDDTGLGIIHYCKTLPAACTDELTCDCLDGSSCPGPCEQDGDGNLFYTCMGG